MREGYRGTQVLLLRGGRREGPSPSPLRFGPSRRSSFLLRCSISQERIPQLRQRQALEFLGQVREEDTEAIALLSRRMQKHRRDIANLRCSWPGCDRRVGNSYRVVGESVICSNCSHDTGGEGTYIGSTQFDATKPTGSAPGRSNAVTRQTSTGTCDVAPLHPEAPLRPLTSNLCATGNIGNTSAQRHG